MGAPGPLRISVPPGFELDAQAVAEIRARREEDERREVEAITRRWQEAQERRTLAKMGLEPGDAPECNPSALDGLVAHLRDGGGANALLWGPPGTGKTSCAKRALRALGRGCFLREADMASSLMSCFRGAGSYEAMVGAWSDAPVLVLDDMGKAAPGAYKDWLLTAVYQVADARWSARLPTVVTSQFCATDLAAKMAAPDVREAVYSRFFANAKIMHFTGPDRRRDG